MCFVLERGGRQSGNYICIYQSVNTLYTCEKDKASAHKTMITSVFLVGIEYFVIQMCSFMHFLHICSCVFPGQHDLYLFKRVCGCKVLFISDNLLPLARSS